MQPPTQELVVRDLHDNTWTFRHIYRGKVAVHFNFFFFNISYIRISDLMLNRISVLDFKCLISNLTILHVYAL